LGRDYIGDLPVEIVERLIRKPKKPEKPKKLFKVCEGIWVLESLSIFLG